MNLRLDRDLRYPDCTLGKLYRDGVFQCFTLEDPVRPDGVKVYGETAIPYGDYTVDITWSPKFKRLLPLLINVQHFVGIRIHPGNTARDTVGCILVGEERERRRVNNSRRAFDPLFARLQDALNRGERIILRIPAPLPSRP